ncbi:hypothetical protein K503DRAFT_799133 [Rhizopogon vinicolor AM-OR11-026]|uniref:Uncharacterized protein n=1 Tax=Rhizopogon vinicolor AM-OR11-026 TaxID=1314800 RepID=A0A1B7N5D8_9AGAM|nr:hypothetical protein K503DRAFT_799133 [Rhizopogon vinicolor AM-OR11-026]
MSPRRSARALKPTSSGMNEAPLGIRHGTRTTKNLNPASCPGKLDTDEATLRNLSRAELQKLAKENKVKANMKSESIIAELVKLCEVVPVHQDDESDKPLRKKSITSLHDQPEVATSWSPQRATEETPAAGCSIQIMDATVDAGLDHSLTQDGCQKSALATENTAPTIACGNAADITTENSEGTLQGPSAVLESQTGHPPPEDDTSDSGSDLSYASKHDRYESPVSSRAGTPPLEEPMMLERVVNIMNQIAADDQRILSQIAALRERAAMLQEQAKKARDVVRGEQGRRVRLEAYFTYWREMEPEWPKGWLYEEGEEGQHRTEQNPAMIPSYVLRLSVTSSSS